ncbi:MAG: peptide-methionine (R)-S-oxide reductase MsrB [Myxococcales bacterium]|nr:peptide-methionine (R)-S-oxide reductase MsrB [Myxococcales bacterium]
MIDWTEVVRRSAEGNPAPPGRVEKTPDQWREHLPPDVFQVTRLAGTERPFSSDMCTLFGSGIYACACCDTVLFDATEKFDSGTGWPSFTQPMDDTTVAYIGDSSHGMVRIEATCAVCDAHLGHVFPDGPPPSGLRYCMNALALRRN